MAKQLIGGWQVSTITYLRTGTPFNPSFSATQTGWRGGRPDLVAGAQLYPDEKTMNMWFNPAAFSTPAPFTFEPRSKASTTSG